ncbi:MAG: S9 family peptidase [Xanthomonadales bacterium]|nr:S9 family peptidase [Xanthomonadales bacterium]
MPNRRRLLFWIVLCCCPALFAADSHPPFSRMDVFELEWVSDPQLSPDGKRIVFVRNGMDVMKDNRTARLWLVNADGSGNQPLTGRDVDEGNPAWSPDGSRVAFTSAGPAGAEIFVTWVDTGKTTRLTQLERSPSGLSWSPDGEWIAFRMLVPEKPPMLVDAPTPPKDAEWAEKPRVTTRLKYERDGAGYMEPGFEHYFVLSHLGGTPRQVTTGSYRHDSAPEWTPDGEALVFSGNRNENWELDYRNSEIYRVPVNGGDVVALTDQPGPDADPVVSPNGRMIAWSGFEDRKQTYQIARLHVMDSDGSNRRLIPLELDRSVASVVWDEDGKGLYFQYDDQGDTKIGHTTLQGRFREVATNLGGTTIGRPYGGGSFSMADDGSIAYTHGTAHRPAELAVVDRRGRSPEVISEFNADLLPWRSLGEVEEVWYESSVDGRRIQGWLVKPPDYAEEGRPYPLLVENHGGPISNYGARFSPEIQLYAAAGYVVFYPNPRGSTGYGEAFGNLLYHDYPGNDYQDVMDGVDYLIETGITAEDRLYVTGGSAGGIMTAWMVGKNQRFRAAAVVKPVMNWISKTLTADNYFMYADYRYPGQPWENIETYMKYSPVSLVGNIQTPTLVMVGTEDLRTPISEAKQLYGALKIRGIDTALVELPGAPHNIAKRPSQLIAKVDHVLAWMEKYPPPTAAAKD